MVFERVIHFDHVNEELGGIVSADRRALWKTSPSVLISLASRSQPRRPISFEEADQFSLS